MADMLIDKIDNYITSEHHEHVHGMPSTMSSSNTTLGYKRPSIDSMDLGMLVGLVSFYGIVAVTALVSNILILITICRRLVPRNTVNIFLASLAVSDLLMVSLSVFDCVAFLNGGWTFGVWSCKIQSIFIEVSFTASTLTLVAVSCERYLLICHPHMKRRTTKAIYVIVVSMWIGAIVIASILLFAYTVYLDIDHEEQTVSLVCGNEAWSDKQKMVFYSVYSFIIYLLPLIIMAFTHWKISKSVQGRRPSMSLLHTRHHEKKASVCFTIQEESSGDSNNGTNGSLDGKRKQSGAQKSLLNALKRKTSTVDKEANRRDRRLKAVRLLFVVTVVFFLLWTPFIVIRLLLTYNVDVNKILYRFSEILILSSTAVNGFIYAFMSPPFRNAFKAIITCRSRRDTLSRDSGPSMSNSEDNKLSHRFSKGSTFSGFSYGVDSRNGTLNTNRKLSNGGMSSL